jgi:hypothetical protein
MYINDEYSPVFLAFMFERSPVLNPENKFDLPVLYFSDNRLT